MPEPARILIVDDDPIVADSLADFLGREGYATATACDGKEALTMLEIDADTHPGGGFGILIADMNMPRCDGMELLKGVRKNHESVVPIVVTGFGKIDSAVEAVRLGAVDYLTKPVVDDELRLAVNKAVNQHTLVHENKSLKTQLSERFGMGNLIGNDYRMQKVYDLVEAVAESKTTVLVTGESGTGKSMVGRAIHTMSPRSGGPFITFACGSIPETLLESELFGHVKGAFTGADTDKPGKCLAADGGTLLIDEINSATPALQLKLLRVLQEKAFEPVGSTKTIHVDVRFVLATNQSLAEMVESGQFREDLYYRINVVNIAMPPLRDRTGDVPVLAEHFLEKHCKELGRQRKFSDEAVEALRVYTWPGNVRELENAVERAVVLSKANEILLTDLPDPIIAATHPGSVPGSPGSPGASSNGINPSGTGPAIIPALAGGWNPMPLSAALQEPERRIIIAALQANGWNRQETARQLDINRSTLYKKIKQYHLDEPGMAG
jgi:DNA-binding NtrC family response regulator